MSVTYEIEVFREQAANEMTPEQFEAGWAHQLSGIEPWHRERKMHDSDGFIAREAWSPGCLAAGHVQETEDSDGDGERLIADGIHVDGWDCEAICKATKEADACCACESEDCEFNLGALPDLWSMVGAKGVS